MKTDCPVCRGRKSVSEGPWQSRWWRNCHRCGWKQSEEWSQPLWEAAGSPTRRFQGGGRVSTPDGQENVPDGLSLAWLGKYGVSWRQFQSLGGRYADGRLVFSCPAFEAKRAADPSVKPKWLSTVRKPLGASRIDEWGWGKGNTLVITEDSLAALKGALAGFHGFPLLGTNVRQLSPTKFLGYRIRVLTDPDEAGRLAGQRLAWLFRGMDIRVHNGREPKEYTLEELREICL